MVGVEQWAEIRRLHFVRGLSIREIHRRTGLHRDTIRRAIDERGAAALSRGRRRGRSSIRSRTRSTGCCARIRSCRGQRVRELIAPLGFDGGKTIVDDYLREVRPLFAPPPRTFQRTVYRPGEICQFDLWEPQAEVPVGHGQTRRGWVVVACLGYSRAGAGALIFSKQTPDLLAGIARCLWSLGALPQTLVWDRQAGIHAPRRPPDGGVRRVLRPAAGRLALLRAGRSAGQGRRRAAAGLRRDATSSRAGRSPTSSTSRTSSTPGSRSAPTRAQHKTLRCRPVDRLAEEREVMAPLPARAAGHRPALGDAGPARSAPALRHLRLLAGPRRWSAGASRSASRDREVTAVALDTGELACRHQRSLRPAPHDHRARARPRAAGPAAPTPSRRSRSGRWRATTR